MQVVYARESPPDSFSKAIFLAGPTSVSKEVLSWRPDALEIFEDFEYEGVIFIPEPRDGKWDNSRRAKVQQIEWEERCLNMADCILFWVPRDMKTLPGLTTNIEWGVWHNSGKVVFGAPPEAEHVSYMQYYADKLQVPSATTLRDTVELALDLVRV